MQRGKLKLAILSISMLQQISAGILPVMANIKQAFPDISTSVIMQLVSLPFIFSIPVSLICGRLAEKFSQKKILLFGVCLTSVAGIVPTFVESFAVILLTRIFVGIGVGLVIPFMVSLISDSFKGAERDKLFGLQGSFVCIGSMLYYLWGGILGAVSWHLNFLIFLIGFLIMAFILRYLPEQRRVEKADTNKSVITKKQSLFCFLMFVIALLSTIFSTRLSFLLTKEGMGDAAMAGIITTFSSLGGLIAGFFYGRLFKITGNFAIALSVFLIGFGSLIAGIAHQTGLMMLASFMIGIGTSITVAAFMTKIALVSTKESSTFVMAIYMSSISLGMSAAPFFTSFVATLFPSVTDRNLYFIAATLLSAYALSSFIINLGLMKGYFRVLTNNTK